MELNIRTYAGMGDILHSKQLLDEVKDNYDAINVYFDINCLRDYKGNYNQFSEFNIKLLEELFSEPPYIIKDIEQGISLPPIHLCSHIGSQFKILNFEKYFCKQSTGNRKEEDYIVILTKIRGLDYSFYQSIRERFFNSINILSQKNKIYIMGERKIGMNNENQIHGPNQMYSIYEDLIQNIQNIGDLTVEELGITAPKYEDFLNDCQTMNMSKSVICLGFSGAVDMAMSVSNIVNYYGNFNMYDMMPKENGKYLTNNLEKFFQKLDNI